ncbi:sigma 54-interacting transcriptional regulator [Mesonia sp. MT50]|uniref:Sigma 54-interacting transcriptional regulator n=1 Tax=Mesonia profundi TaxID=3070998 RepID=A0ABU0ZYX5_9FLAO|nr:sigma 54-interacting transcriptional regulator [Mesonia profundi]MDQ7916665.1 sigma 54-interacting transcriptional regulator [Mesonia profundi]
MNLTEIKTFGQLKEAHYQSKSIKEELRQNLIEKIKKKENVFEGIHGYEKTVIPELERAILSKHNINLLGLRGQAKTRIARLMIQLLDEYIPVVEGSEINDDPFHPISRYARQTLEEKGDDTPITWLHREDRFAEKLATPDVTVADLIGDVDPIKAANLKLSYADDRVIHFGMIPRANRSIFVINELPDLQARIQVALFNILQEGDIQIRGFKLRMPLDLQFIFTANPEDYTNRGSIVTPLKDRIGSQILTHYPQDIETAKKITAQEVRLEESQHQRVMVPEIAKDVLEQISFEARKSEYVDVKSGISARMSITAFQNLLSTAERRAILLGEEKTSLRLSDFTGIIPAITGKVELVYEGEQEGADFVAKELMTQAVKTLFLQKFPKIEKLQKQDEETSYDDLLHWFFNQEGVVLTSDLSDKEYQKALMNIEPLPKLVDQYVPNLPEEERFFMMEMVLWGLAAHQKLSKHEFAEGNQFQDLYGNYINNL